jgi:hypothetical protein
MPLEWSDTGDPWKGFRCAQCGAIHSGLPQSYAVAFPDEYHLLSEVERKTRALIGSDQCVIDDEKYYIRGIIEIPIIGFPGELFLWGVWACVWKEDFDVISEHWNRAGRESLIGPFKGRLNNLLTGYKESTRNLKCSIHIRPAGERPVFVMDEPTHALTREQRGGIDLERIAEFASQMLHS